MNEVDNNLAERALTILQGIRNNLDTTNLNMETFFARTGYGRVARDMLIRKIKTQEEFKKEITIREGETDCNTACCLAGMIPSVDWKWAKQYEMDFNVMSRALTDTLLPPKLQGDDCLWLWLFSSNWSNDKDWAKERLDLVINSKAFYVLKHYTKYSNKSLRPLKDVNSIEQLGELVDHKIDKIERLYILN